MTRAAAVRVGLLGFGTIGTGVAKVLARNAAVIERRLGAPLRLLRIADLELSRDRGVALGGIRFDADAEGLVRDPGIDIVVELIGGTGAARRLLLLAIEAGKPVVTANKALLAQHGKEIFDAAAEHGVDVGFGQMGEGHVRFALIENRHRIRQAVRNIRRFLRDAGA